MLSLNSQYNSPKRCQAPFSCQSEQLICQPGLLKASNSLAKHEVVYSVSRRMQTPGGRERAVHDRWGDLPP